MRYVLYLWLILCFSACSDVWDITPYDGPPRDGPRDLTALNIQRWQIAMQEHMGPITIAFTSDAHFHYGDLADIVDKINSDASVDVVMVPGDLTDQGLLEEFQWFTSIMMELNKPWIATIGNHDHLSNGQVIYESMFGPRDLHVDVAGYRFIFFDDTVWESERPPDLAWLNNALQTKGDLIPIVIAHIPATDDQMMDGSGVEMHQILHAHEVPLFVHGHLHGFRDHVPFNDGVRYLCVPWPRERQYVKVIIDQSDIQIELIEL